MKAYFIRMQWENDARSIASFYFEPEHAYRYEAGQYADLTVPHAGADNRGQTRTMTFSSSPSDPLLRITTRLPLEGQQVSSYKLALCRLTAGDVVQLTDSMGDMVLPLDTTIPLVLVAGGVGIASYIGMFEWIKTTGISHQITLLHGVRSLDDVIFRDVCNELSTAALFVYASGEDFSQTPPSLASYQYVPGRLDAPAVHTYMTVGCQVYLSGSESMVEQIRRELQETFQVPQYQIAFDYFSGYTTTEI